MTGWMKHNLEGVVTLAPTASAYLSPERSQLQAAARTFAMDEVLPIANELDPQRADIPRARTREPAGDRRADGLEIFLVEKDRDAFPAGISGTVIDKIGYFGLTTWELEFDGLRLPADALQDTGQDEGQGFQESLRWLNVARVQTAARAVGLARGALEDATAYAQSRVQFGQPIAEQQSIRFMLATMAADVEAARQLWYHAAWLVDDLDTVDNVEREPADVDAAQAKLVASETAERVTSQALQIFGGNGYTTEYAVERYWRDARLTTIFEGTSEIQRKIISDGLLRA